MNSGHSVQRTNVSSSKPLDAVHSANSMKSRNGINGSAAAPASARGRPVAVPTNARLLKQKQIKVKRTGYKYGGRGFDIWRRNMAKPMYTTTSLRVNKTFRGNERLARKWMVEKAGFIPVQIEGVTFVEREGGSRGRGRGRGGRGGAPSALKDGKEKLTVIRVRASLRDIFAKIARMDANPEFGKGLMTKQNNRSRSVGGREQSRKLYVNNFDILDAQCHRQLTKMFLKFGDLEQEIWIDRDRQQNPFAVVYFRSLSAAKKCWNEHNDKSKTPLFFPTKKEMDRDKKGYLNRRLHIEYNREENAANGRARGRPRGRGRGRGRGR